MLDYNSCMKTWFGEHKSYIHCQDINFSIIIHSPDTNSSNITPYASNSPWKSSSLIGWRWLRHKKIRSTCIYSSPSAETKFQTHLWNLVHDRTGRRNMIQVSDLHYLERVDNNNDDHDCWLWWFVIAMHDRTHWFKQDLGISEGCLMGMQRTKRLYFCR